MMTASRLVAAFIFLLSFAVVAEAGVCKAKFTYNHTTMTYAATDCSGTCASGTCGEVVLTGENGVQSTGCSCPGSPGGPVCSAVVQTGPMSGPQGMVGCFIRNCNACIKFENTIYDGDGVPQFTTSECTCVDP